MNDFVHLHVHTEFSTLDGINRVDTLPEYAKGLGFEAVAITDHGTLSGAYKFYKSCNKAKIKPIIGIEAYYTVGDRTAKEKDADEEKYYHLVLLAKNKQGLKNLFKLSSQSYIDGMYFKPRIDDAILADLSSDLYATSSCLGSRSSWLILNGQKEAAERLLDHHAQIFKDRFFLELQLHVDDKQQVINQALIEFSKKRNWPLILTNDCHYTEQEDKLIHERALCIQTNDKMSNPDRFSFGDIDVHFAKEEWMRTNALQQGIPLEAIHNTYLLSKEIESHTYFDDIYNKYPKFQSLPEGMTADQALERLSKQKLVEMFGCMPPKEYQERINYELKVIKRLGFSDYMLIQWEIIEGAKSVEVMVGPGRGSAAGSLVAFALGITQVDPLKYDLLFDRFLNVGRGATPMIFTDSMKEIAKNYIGCELDHNHNHECKH